MARDESLEPDDTVSETDDSKLIRKTLRELLKAPDVPAAAKAQAARTLAEMVGLLGRHQDKPSELDSRPLSGLSQEGLRAELARLHGLGD